jgi:TATA-box binding protein (TBP) (component of TFIID and TFIIIB)
MDEEALNTSIRKFLRTFGVNAQREIERAVRNAVSNGKLKDNPRLPAKAILTVGEIDLKYEVEGDIELA